MSMTTWDPSDTGGWRLSNANLTATSPNNNTMGAISVGYATTAIPDHSKTYYEFKVSGAAIQTAFTVGFGVHGFDPSNKNIHNVGAHIGNATFLGFSYNLTETNSGNVVYDPQGNWNYAATHPGAIAAPNQWGNGAVVGVMVDRINNNAQFTLNGTTEGPPIDISGMAGKTLYPFADSWFRSGPVATINGGANGFAENTPAGYTALDGTAASHGATVPASTITQWVQPSSGPSFIVGSPSGTITPPATAGGSSATNTVTVNQPTTLAATVQTITGTESDPSQPVYLDWRTYGIPAKGDSDWVKASVNADGSFSAQVNIDHAGIRSGMFDYAGTGPVQQAWSQTPH
jgi:hypothetical protein